MINVLGIFLATKTLGQVAQNQLVEVGGGEGSQTDSVILVYSLYRTMIYDHATCTSRLYRVLHYFRLSVWALYLSLIHI